MSNERRKILGAIAAAVVLSPKAWTRPVVGSVLLPAHAQTSPGLGDVPPEGSKDSDPNPNPKCDTGGDLIMVTSDANFIKVKNPFTGLGPVTDLKVTAEFNVNVVTSPLPVQIPAGTPEAPGEITIDLGIADDVAPNFYQGFITVSGKLGDCVKATGKTAVVIQKPSDPNEVDLTGDNDPADRDDPTDGGKPTPPKTAGDGGSKPFSIN